MTNRSESHNAPATQNVAEQGFDVFDAFFRQCPELTYIYLAINGDGTGFSTVSPDVVSGVALAAAAIHGFAYYPPSPGRNHIGEGTKVVSIPSHVIPGIAARVEEIQRRGTAFLLIWNLAGEITVHVAGDLQRFKPELLDALKNELDELLLYY